MPHERIRIRESRAVPRIYIEHWLIGFVVIGTIGNALTILF